jgi:hypothetical protein
VPHPANGTTSANAEIKPNRQPAMNASITMRHHHALLLSIAEA